MKSASLNGSNISSNIANFACWMKCWTCLSRPLDSFAFLNRSKFKKKILSITLRTEPIEAIKYVRECFRPIKHDHVRRSVVPWLVNESLWLIILEQFLNIC